MYWHAKDVGLLDLSGVVLMCGEAIGGKELAAVYNDTQAGCVWSKTGGIGLCHRLGIASLAILTLAENPLCGAWTTLPHGTMSCVEQFPLQAYRSAFLDNLRLCAGFCWSVLYIPRISLCLANAMLSDSTHVQIQLQGSVLFSGRFSCAVVGISVFLSYGDMIFECTSKVAVWDKVEPLFLLAVICLAGRFFVLSVIGACWASIRTSCIAKL